MHSKLPKMDESWDQGPTPQKRPKLGCIIHCSSDDSKPATLQSVESWKSLLRAAQIRQHTPLLELSTGLQENQVPHIQYHRKCCSVFTMKCQLDAILNKGNQNQGPDVEAKDTSTRKSSRAAPSTSQV